VYEALLAGRPQALGYVADRQKAISATFEGVHFERHSGAISSSAKGFWSRQYPWSG
jgi:hypothetical protein